MNAISTTAILTVEEIDALPIGVLADRAERAQHAADRAFRRYFEGEVEGTSAAQRLQNIADECARDFETHDAYDLAKDETVR